MIIGNRVYEERKKKGLTQTQLGDLLGVTKVSVCGYEKGARTPTLETFVDLLNILDVSPDYLLGRDIKVVSEPEIEYQVKMPKEAVVFFKELKKNTDLYNRMIEDPKRLVEVINKKLS